MKKTTSAKSFAKIILFGEHSVVYKQPAIALPLYSVDVNVTITPRDTGQWIESRYYDGPIDRLNGNLLGVKKLINWIVTNIGDPAVTFTLKITSKIPSERGMGSSAATAVAITRALYDFFEVPLSRAELLKIANIEELVTHGNPSGIDTATVSSDNPVWFVKNQQNEQIDFNLSSDFLVVADSGIKGKTSAAVGLIAENKITNPDAVNPLIKQLGKIAIQAREGLRTANSGLIGKLMTESHQILCKLGVSTPTLDRFVKLAINSGAYGAKLTGSGMGGCMIALVDSSQKAQKLATTLRNAGATSTWIQSFKKYGYKTEVEDDYIG